jgi:hypothetical protein
MSEPCSFCASLSLTEKPAQNKKRRASKKHPRREQAAQAID